jgi:hypothetical protein
VHVRPSQGVKLSLRSSWLQSCQQLYVLSRVSEPRENPFHTVVSVLRVSRSEELVQTHLEGWLVRSMPRIRFSRCLHERPRQVRLLSIGPPSARHEVMPKECGATGKRAAPADLRVSNFHRRKVSSICERICDNSPRWGWKFWQKKCHTQFADLWAEMLKDCKKYEQLFGFKKTSFPSCPPNCQPPITAFYHHSKYCSHAPQCSGCLFWSTTTSRALLMPSFCMACIA